jgi:hypothetical protein
MVRANARQQAAIGPNTKVEEALDLTFFERLLFRFDKHVPTASYLLLALALLSLIDWSTLMEMDDMSSIVSSLVPLQAAVPAFKLILKKWSSGDTTDSTVYDPVADVKVVTEFANRCAPIACWMFYDPIDVGSYKPIADVIWRRSCDKDQSSTQLAPWCHSNSFRSMVSGNDTPTNSISCIRWCNPATAVVQNFSTPMQDVINLLERDIGSYTVTYVIFYNSLR